MKFAAVYTPRRNWPKWDWVADAIQSRGHNLVKVHAAEELLAADSWADAVLFEHRDCGIGRRYVRDVHQKRQSLWVQWWWDLIAVDAAKSLSEQLLIEQCGEVMRCMDVVLVKERGYLPAYGRLGINAAYMDQACPSWFPQIAHPQSPVFDVLMFGQSKERRTQVAAALVRAQLSSVWATSDPVPAGVVPLPWCHPDNLPSLMSQAVCTLSMNVRGDVDGYCSDRDWLIRGCGAVEVQGETPEQVVEAVRRVKALSASERATLGAEARQRTMQGNTYEDRIDAIVKLVEGFRCGTSLQNLQRDEDGCQPAQRACKETAVSGV